VAEAFAVAATLPARSRILDLGCGNGVPISIARHDEVRLRFARPKTRLEGEFHPQVVRESKHACKEQVKNRRLDRVLTASCAATCFYMGRKRRKGAALMVSPIQAFAKTDDSLSSPLCPSTMSMAQRCATSYRLLETIITVAIIGAIIAYGLYLMASLPPARLVA
jgi:hypothetical protein